MKQGKIPLVLLVCDGTKVPGLLEYTKRTNSKSYLALIISNKENFRFLSLAQQNKIPTAIFPWNKESQSREDLHQEVADYIVKFLGEDYQNNKYYIISGGWPYVMSANFFERFSDQSLINLHPGLLPDSPNQQQVSLSDGRKIPALRNLYSLAMFEEVIKQKLPVTGVTVHFLTKKVDSGKVIFRLEVPVLPGDSVSSLAERVHDQEDQALQQALDMIL